MALLVLWDLKFPEIDQPSSLKETLKLILDESVDRPYPSYKPIVSCTKSRISLGRSDGRKAVVRVTGWKYIYITLSVAPVRSR